MSQNEERKQEEQRKIKKEERTKKHKGPNSLYLHNFLSLVFSLFWSDCDLVGRRENNQVLPILYVPSFQPNNLLTISSFIFHLLFSILPKIIPTKHAITVALEHSYQEC